MPSQIPLYQIVDWSSHFENAKSRTIAKCQYCCVPNKQGGGGWSNLMGEVDGAAIYGIWMSIAQYCSRQQPPRTGYLTADGKKDGRRPSVRELSNLFRRPVMEIHRCLQVVTSSEVGFMALIDGTSEAEQEHLTRSSRIPDGHLEDTSRVAASYAEGSAVSLDHPALGGYLEDTSGSYLDQLQGQGLKDRRNEYSLPDPNPSEPIPETEPDTSRIGGGHTADTSPAREGRVEETSRIPEGQSEDTIDSVDEAKELLSKLCEDVFGFRFRPQQWPNDIEHFLADAMPLPRGDLALLDWFYRAPVEHEIFKVTMRRQSFPALMENLLGEVQKVRSARKSIGLNGLEENSERGTRIAEWPEGAREAAAKLWGAERVLPERMADLPASALRDLKREMETA